LIAGVAAAAARQWRTAEDHFEIALQHAVAFPQRLEDAEIRRFHAMMLMERAAQLIARRRKGYLVKRCWFIRA
jgi:hypothetical protein